VAPDRGGRRQPGRSAAATIIGISSIHLLKTFINADNYTDRVLIAQTAIHITFLLSAMAIAYTDRIMTGIRPDKH
jgi:uncharacterized protein (TIGR00645 family)